eukprot:TRINITY_DN15579_c0_g1_i2.p2 TRINITY_DN15579_c0_g1~~TRINITY_DN15579_c0_g1_i2.p2  ORF type:complete len:153 (+),score=31.60 TRINITY_DN15579_c0_g1_i2:112-570(+)
MPSLVGSEMCIRDSINAEYMGRNLILPTDILLYNIQRSDSQGLQKSIIKGLLPQEKERFSKYKFNGVNNDNSSSCQTNENNKQIQKQMINQQQISQQCSICLQEFEQSQIIKVLFCNHQFHQKCIDIWLDQSILCPLCKSDQVVLMKKAFKK